MTIHLLPPCEHLPAPNMADDTECPCEDACLGGDACVCDDHPQDDCECEGRGEISVLVGTTAVLLPCPNCPAGDPT